jgi:uncharacterized protein YjiS (DUF1127 family)
MSALPDPRPQPKRSRKQALRELARLLENQMDEMGLSEAEKNARAKELEARVERAVARASRVATPSK